MGVIIGPPPDGTGLPMEPGVPGEEITSCLTVTLVEELIVPDGPIGVE